MAANPDVKRALDDVAAEFETMFFALCEDQSKLVTAAERAGLPNDRRADAKKIVTDAYDAFRAYSESVFKLQQEGDECRKAIRDSSKVTGARAGRTSPAQPRRSAPQEFLPCE